MTWLLVLTLACGGGSADVRWPVEEALDVPPPPGAVTLELGPVRTDMTFTPGDRLRISLDGHAVNADLVDSRVIDGKISLTVYAAAHEVRPWIDSGGPVVVRKAH